MTLSVAELSRKARDRRCGPVWLTFHLYVGPPATPRGCDVVERPPVGSGARAGCGRAAPGCSSERRRLTRARHRIESQLMSSRGPAANLRPVSRSAVTAFSLGPSEPAREPVRLPDPAAVSQARQAHPFGVTPRIRVCVPCHRAAAPRQHPGCNLPFPTACSTRVRVELRKWRSAASIVTSCAAHPSCPRHEPGSDRVFGSSAFPRRSSPSVPRLSVPLAHGPSVSHT
jgi:hypothetical protein